MGLRCVVAGIGEVERKVQKSYWEEHSKSLTVESMMLDSRAADLDKEERPEVLHDLLSLSLSLSLSPLSLPSSVFSMSLHRFCCCCWMISLLLLLILESYHILDTEKRLVRAVMPRPFTTPAKKKG
jgi:hypothetical protein